jgi:hypothetical protein
MWFNKPSVILKLATKLFAPTIVCGHLTKFDRRPQTIFLMKDIPPVKVRSLVELFDRLPENERIIVDVLRQIILEHLPVRCREKISYNVPFFYGNKGICIIWPSSIPRGGIKEGVLLGFWYGNKLKDPGKYLVRGTNKQIFYRIIKTPEEINDRAIINLLKEAIVLDEQWKK